MVEKFFIDHPMLANCWLIADEKNGRAAVVDPAWLTDEMKEILTDRGIEVEYILLTHGHFDHILGVAALKEFSGAKIAIHAEDADCLHDEEKSLAKGNTNDFTPANADILLNDGDVLKVGDIEIKVMHTPGHTPGGVCYIIEDEKTILTGDTLFCMTVGRTDFPGGSSEILAESLEKLIALDGDYVILPGHNRETTLERERTRNRFIRRM